MEKLLIKSNGQWALTKAQGDPDYDATQHGNSPFKDETSADLARTDYISKLSNRKYAEHKSMPNIHTGKDEPHVLLHRGMSTHDPLKSQTGPNMLDWSSGNTVKTSYNSIHTLHPEEAKSHIEEAQGSHYEYDHAKMLSFWVPASSIHGHSSDINRHVNPSGKYHDDPDHTMIAPGEYKIHNEENWKDGKKEI